MSGVDYDEAKVSFKRIYSRIEEQESLGRKMFKDEADKDAWEYLKMYFEAGQYERRGFDPLDWSEEENDGEDNQDMF